LARKVNAIESLKIAKSSDLRLHFINPMGVTCPLGLVLPFLWSTIEMAKNVSADFWFNLAEEKLVGRKIIKIRKPTEQECTDLGITMRTPILVLDDGHSFFVSDKDFYWQ